MMKIELHFLNPIQKSEHYTKIYGLQPDIEVVYKVTDYYVRDGVLYIETRKDVFDELEEPQIEVCYPIVNLKKWIPYSGN